MASEYITLDELRALADSLPHGAPDAIARELGLAPAQVRAFLAAQPLPDADPRAVIHAEQGTRGGTLFAPCDDILAAARRIAQVHGYPHQAHPAHAPAPHNPQGGEGGR